MSQQAVVCNEQRCACVSWFGSIKLAELAAHRLKLNCLLPSAQRRGGHHDTSVSNRCNQIPSTTGNRGSKNCHLYPGYALTVVQHDTDTSLSPLWPQTRWSTNNTRILEAAMAKATRSPIFLRATRNLNPQTRHQRNSPRRLSHYGRSLAWTSAPVR